MNTTKRKTPTKRCCRGWEIDSVLEEIKKLRSEVKYLRETCVEQTITVYSAESDICIGMNSPLWHRIVCNYEGDVCIGTPRHHWQSKWSLQSDGFHLERFVDENWRGWSGQYRPDNALRFDQLPESVLNLHHTTLIQHVQKLGLWYPCAIYNDFTGDMYRP